MAIQMHVVGDLCIGVKREPKFAQQSSWKGESNADYGLKTVNCPETVVALAELIKMAIERRKEQGAA